MSFKKAKRIPMCASWIASMRTATKHKRKVFRLLDAENQKLDQLDLLL